MESSQPLNVPREFDIEAQFDNYLNLVKLDKRKMPPYQLRETKRAFYGAWGIQLVLQREVLTKYEEDKGVQLLEHMFQQVSKFWNVEIAPDVFNQN